MHFDRLARNWENLAFQTAVAPEPGPAPLGAADEEVEDEARIEMHPLSRREIDEAVASHGGRVEIEEADAWAGAGWTSAHYLVRKVE